jgi:hypothetical protein
VRTGKILRFSEPESQKSFKNRALRAPENIFTRGKSAKIASRAKNADPAKMTHSVPTFLTCTCNEFSNILPIVREKPGREIREDATGKGKSERYEVKTRTGNGTRGATEGASGVETNHGK